MDTQKKLFVTMGVSGSGKSTYTSSQKDLYEYTVICPDQIRKELTGTIDDQTKNAEVFALAFARTSDALARGETVIFDSTALRKDTRETLIKIAKDNNAEAVLVKFTDSENLEICRNRVIEDITNGVERSNTICKDDILKRQCHQYISAVCESFTEDWDMTILI